MNIQVEYSKMRSESSEYMLENNRFLHKQLENQSSLGELLLKNMPRKFGRAIRMDLEVHTTLLNMYNSTLIVAILKALHEQF